MAARTARSGWVRVGAMLALGTLLAFGPRSLAADEKKAADEKAKPAAAEEKKADAKSADGASVKLTKPWSDLTSLTDEQRLQIKQIHTKALGQINEIERQEKADIMAVLNDDQKKELQEVLAKARKSAAEKRAANKRADGDTKSGSDTKKEPAAKTE